MAQVLSNSFIQTAIPGSYPNIKVTSTPVGFSSSGNVVIIGESEGGRVYSDSAFSLSSNYYTASQFQQVKQDYVSGQIVDGFQALIASSADTDITGAPNRIYVVKTNTSVRAQATMDTDFGTLKDLNWGKAGNKYKYTTTAVYTETAPTVTSGAIPALGAPLNAASFTVRLNGAAATVITLSGVAGDHNTTANLAIELNLQLPSGLVASAPSVSTIKLTVTADATAYRKGHGKSFELVDSTPGGLAALGLVIGLSTSAQEPGVEVNIIRSDTNVSEIFDINAVIALNIGYVGTTATCTINQTTKLLATTVAGGSGASQSIDMTNYTTVADLADYINTLTGYSCSATTAAQKLPTTCLDAVSAIGICSTAASTKPGRIKKSAYDSSASLNTSRSLSFTITSAATLGIPSPTTVTQALSGGTRGATLAADIIAAIALLPGIDVNFLIPLFSRDATSDITDLLTDSLSTYTIAALNTACKNHVLQYSTPKLKKHRQAALSFWDGTYTSAKSQAQSLATYRCSLTIQKATQNNSLGVTTTFMPWYSACVAAGMQTAGFYKSITNKLANVTSFTDPTGYDSSNPGNVEDALYGGMLVLTKNVAGNSWVSDQTTYGYDTNFVYNAIQTVYTSDILSLDLAASFQSAFVGKSNADVDASAALAFLVQKATQYKKLKLTASSDDAALGFKNPSITLNGPELDVSAEFKLSSAIYFIPINVNLSQVTQSA